MTLVAMDFDHQDIEPVLSRAGFLLAQPAFFIWEGVTQYITEKAVLKVFEYLRKASLGSQLVMTYILTDFIDGEQMYGLSMLYNQTRVQKQLWQFGMQPQLVRAFLGQYAWQELEQVGTAEYQARYLEPVNRVLPVMDVERAVHAERMA